MANKKHYTPNDQRSNVKNPNNPAFKADRDNRSRQLNDQHLPSKGPDHPVRQANQQPEKK